MNQRYVGRFAPTPSGPLHLGSLLTAVASWLDARAHKGRWLLRIDDADTPRVAAGAEAAIRRALIRHGLVWQGRVVRQSDLRPHHRAALRGLRGHTFACACTRAALRGADRYPGTCRHLGLPPAGNAVRVRADQTPAFADRVQGRIQGSAEMDDFVVWRRDDLPAYPLAVVVDDHVMGVTDVVRGADLLWNTPRQLHLMGLLGHAAPSYAHIPLIVNAADEKLSKHTAATAVDEDSPLRNLTTVLALLGLDPPSGQRRPEQLLDWASQRWNLRDLPPRRAVRGFVALE